MRRSTAVGLLLLALGAPPILAAGQIVDEWLPGSSEPGARLSFVERGLEEAESGRLMVLYSIVAEGLPTDRAYELWLRRLDGSTTRQPALVRIGDRGVLVSLTTGAETVVAFVEMMAGEPVIFRLTSGAGDVRIVDRHVPFPLEARRRDCRVSLEMTLPGAAAYMAYLSGFESGEEIRVRVRSAYEVMEFGLEIAEDDRTALALAPAVAGLDGGWASLTLTGSACALTLDVPWGTAAEAL